MNPNERSTHSKDKIELSKVQAAAEKSKTNDPPGVSMPPETEMSPPQFG